MSDVDDMAMTSAQVPEEISSKPFGRESELSLAVEQSPIELDSFLCSSQ